MRPGELQGTFGFAVVQSFSHRDRNMIDHYHCKCPRCGTQFIASNAMLKGGQYNEHCVNFACKQVDEQTQRILQTNQELQELAEQRAATDYFEGRIPPVVQQPRILKPTQADFDKCRNESERKAWWWRYHSYMDANGIKVLHE